MKFDMIVMDIKTCNPTSRFSKYVAMLSFSVKVVANDYNQVCSQTLFYNE